PRAMPPPPHNHEHLALRAGAANLEVFSTCTLGQRPNPPFRLLKLRVVRRGNSKGGPNPSGLRPHLATSCRTGASAKGSTGLHMTRSPSRPATPAICAPGWPVARRLALDPFGRL